MRIQIIVASNCALTKRIKFLLLETKKRLTTRVILSLTTHCEIRVKLEISLGVMADTSRQGDEARPRIIIENRVSSHSDGYLTREEALHQRFLEFPTCTWHDFPDFSVLANCAPISSTFFTPQGPPSPPLSSCLSTLRFKWDYLVFN